MTTHSDRDGSETRSLNRFTSPQEATGATPAPLGTGEVWMDGPGDAPCDDICKWDRAPAGQPLHEPADRDADNVPSDEDLADAWDEGFRVGVWAEQGYLKPNPVPVRRARRGAVMTGTVAYFDTRAEAIATDTGVTALIDGQWQDCNPTWAATFQPDDDFAQWAREMGTP